MKTPIPPPLSPFTFLAERFWRRFLPKMVMELERKEQLGEALQEADEQTAAELDDLRRHFLQQGLNPEQAHQTAWEIVRHRYIYLRPET